MFQSHQESYTSNCKGTSDEYEPDPRTNPATARPLVEPPNRGEELRDRDDTEDHGVGGERDIVDLHCRGQPVMTQGILLAYVRRVQEGHVGDEVRREA